MLSFISTALPSMNFTATMAATPFARKLMPSDIAHVSRWKKELIKNIFGIDKMEDERRINPPSRLLQFHSYINELKDLIETDAQVSILFTSMFTEEPQDPDPESRIRDYTEMLNHITTTAPSIYSYQPHPPAFNGNTIGNNRFSR